MDRAAMGASVRPRCEGQCLPDTRNGVASCLLNPLSTRSGSDWSLTNPSAWKGSPAFLTPLPRRAIPR